MTKRIYGHTKSGTPITDELIEELAEEAEAGYDVDEIIARRGKRGRPRLGAEPSTVESVRLDPELRRGFSDEQRTRTFPPPKSSVMPFANISRRGSDPG